MKKIVQESLKLQVYEKSKEDALKFMEERDESYKAEMISELDDSEPISFYKQGDYEEFCAGPHIENVSKIKAVKLLSVAGAYWRGDEKNRMLTRIYGISFPKASELAMSLRNLMVMSMSSVKAGGRRYSLDHKMVAWLEQNKELYGAEIIGICLLSVFAIWLWSGRAFSF